MILSLYRVSAVGFGGELSSPFICLNPNTLVYSPWQVRGFAATADKPRRGAAILTNMFT